MITFGLFDVTVVVDDDDGGVSSALKLRLRVSALDACVEVGSREEAATAAAIVSFILFVLWL